MDQREREREREREKERERERERERENLNLANHINLMVEILCKPTDLQTDWQKNK